MDHYHTSGRSDTCRSTGTEKCSDNEQEFRELCNIKHRRHTDTDCDAESECRYLQCEADAEYCRKPECASGDVQKSNECRVDSYRYPGPGSDEIQSRNTGRTK